MDRRTFVLGSLGFVLAGDAVAGARCEQATRGFESWRVSSTAP